MTTGAPVDLDDLDALAAVDREDALRDVEHAADQWRAAWDERGGVTAPLDLVDHVVVCGVGGSGIVGDIVAAVAQQALDVPLVVHKGYGLPAWVGQATLVVGVSHSGNTEETLDAAHVALERGCPVIAVTSGGRLETLVDDAGQTVISVAPGGMPRHATGALLVPLLDALDLAGEVPAAIDRLADAASRYGRHAPTSDNAAKRIALRLAVADAGVPAIYGAQGVAAVAAYRLRSQLAENAKMRSLHHEVPELQHNEVVGWGDTNVAGAALWLHDGAVLTRNMTAVRSIAEDRFAWHEDLRATGAGPLERYASLAGVGDLISVYAAIARGVDPTPITDIMRLKATLAETSS